MNALDNIAVKIIKEQELIIGPLAWAEAGKVQGLHVVNEAPGEVTLNNGDPKETVNRLVGQYERLFGQASHEVCKEAVASILAELTPAEIPSSLLV
ncbi:MAG: hypothetical protein Q7S76_04070 [bacterium]|nr:hypothetical protein [bacterium]